MTTTCVYFVSDVVDQLDLSAIHAQRTSRRGEGNRRTIRVLMTKLLVYGYCTGVFSSRRIQKGRLQWKTSRLKCWRPEIEPDFRTVSDFRLKIHIETLQKLFEQVLAMALEVGAVKVGRVSLDGTKLKANASKHRAMSYGRMIEKQRHLKDEVKRLLEQAEAADEAEDREYGDRRGDELPEELRRRETRLARIKEAKKVLEQRARDKALAEGKNAAGGQTWRRAPRQGSIQLHRSGVARIATCRARMGLSRAITRKPHWRPTLLLIVGQTVTEASNDKRQLKPMVELIEQQSGQHPQALALADNGYCSEENLKFLASADKPEHKIEGFIATGKQKHGEHRLPAKRGPLPRGRDGGRSNEAEAADQGG